MIPNGAKTEYYYDGRGNRIVEQDALGHQILKEYDENGNVTKIIDESKNVSLMEYDSHNRLVAVTNADGNRATYGKLSTMSTITKRNRHFTGDFID